MTPSSSEVTEEELLILSQADKENETKEQTVERKEKSWKNATERAAKEETQSDKENEIKEQTVKRKEKSLKNATERLANEEKFLLKPRIKEFEMMDGNRPSYSIDGLNANGRIKVEQDDGLENFQI